MNEKTGILKHSCLLYLRTFCNDFCKEALKIIQKFGTLHLSRKGQPQGIAPTIENRLVGAILYGCPQHF